MTTLVEQPLASGTRDEPGGSLKAVLALALFESRRLLTRVPVLLAFAVYLGWTVWRAGRAWGDYPALQDADRATQGAPMLVGLAVLVSVNQAALRSRRHGTERHFAVLLLPHWCRTAAHALSVVAAALVTAVCVAGQFGREALRPGAIGQGSVGELLVGPLTVLLFGLAGLLVAGLVRSALVAPLLVVLFLFLFLFFSGLDYGSRWLLPAVEEPTSNTLPSDLMGRPAAWHALYLAGLALFLGLVAVLVAGGRKPAVLAGAAGALAMTLVGGVAQSGGDSPQLVKARERATVHPEQVQSCVRQDGSTYCAYPEWGPQVGDWAAVVDRVRSLAGGSAHGQDVVVRQRVDARYGLSGDAALDPLKRPHEVTVGTQWGGNRVPEFSAAVAGVLIAGDEEAATSICDGRIVPLMWLAVGWESDPLAALRRVRLNDTVTGSDSVLQPTNGLYMTEAQTEVLRALLDLPRDEAAARVKDRWDDLTAPKITAARAAGLLGLPAPEGEDKCLS
ncbi:ABC transporter permease [Streptomyces violaceochromogenes]|uniref:ABC transporter permease n=1 Tax=Streptomyces violaceochromogenes TaxID=67377 RepID=A0ABU6LZJ2_9ACTN|nr:ABC transporter permease [Streptomyces violaceochromogenes]MEC7054943.1 ABC transporter permease [Streptomyces violaceochromogenes]GHC75720.1 ABC transporter [Streptomyces violaceochromogenes]